jgi:hypothetical protein
MASKPKIIPIRQATTLSKVVSSAGLLRRSVKRRGPQKVTGREVLGTTLKLYNQ